MKINETIQPSTKTLVENFKSDQYDSRFVAEDLVDMVRENEENQWIITPADDYLAKLKAGKPSWL